MKFKVFSAVLILTIVMLGLGAGNVLAGSYDTAFTTSITYQNVGASATTQLEVWFYDSPTDLTPTIVPRNNLNPGAGTSLYIGGLSEIAQGFKGTAILVSDQPMVATLVQIPTGSATVIVRPLSNGFSSGSEDSLIATALKNAFGGQYSIISVQNVGNASTNVDIKFYDTSANLKYVESQTLAAGAGHYVDLGLVPDGDIGSTFNGSVIIESNGGTIISSAMELEAGTRIGASAFEGLGSGAMKFYMPSALCSYYGQNTSYAVQNTSLSTSTNVTVTFSDGSSTTKTIGPGAKASFGACDGGVGSGFLGSAIVESDTTDIIAIGKAYGSGLSTAFVGSKMGTSKIALPYVRWSTDANYFYGTQQRVYIAIQNVGTSTIPAGSITVKYIDRDGNVSGTHTIGDALAAEKKANSTPYDAGLAEFGVYAGGTQFGGGAVIEGPPGSELAAIARVTTWNQNTWQFAAEDFTGIDIP